MFDATGSGYAPAQQFLAFVSSTDEPHAEAVEVRLPFSPPRLNLPVIYRRPQLQEILQEVARLHLLRPADIESRSRVRRITTARQHFMWAARQVINADGTKRFSSPRVAMFFDGKGGRTTPMDHTTVLHAEKRHAERMRLALMVRIRRENAEAAIIHGGR